MRRKVLCNYIKENENESGACIATHLELLLTDNLIVGEAHDVHGLQCLLEVVFILLSRDWNVTI